MKSPTLRDRLEWFRRAPIHHIIWTLCLVIGFVLSWVKKNVLRQPVLEGRYESVAKEHDEEFQDKFHQNALRIVTTSLLKESDIRDFVSIMPWRAAVERKLAMEREVRLGRCLLTTTRPRAVFVIGLPRTGSTLLHQLCGFNPAGRVLRAYELKFPFDHDDPRRLEKTQRMLNAFYFLAPRIKSVHFIKADDPDECIQGFVDCAVPEWVSWGAVEAPSAYRWYVEGDMTPQYLNFEKMIRCIMSRDSLETPVSHIMLKSPHHTWKLPEVARAFPDAQFVWLHRDPVSSVASCASMNEAILDVSCSHFFDSRQLGRRTCERMATCLEKAMRDRAVLEKEQGRRFVDVYYPDLKRDAVETMRQMYAALELPPMTCEAEETIRAFLQTSNAHVERNAHRYSLDHFGLVDSDVRRRFASYLERFPGLRMGSL